jgi:hypothetical protein
VVTTAKEAVVAKNAKAALTAKEHAGSAPVAVSVIFQANAAKTAPKDAEDFSLVLVCAKPS